MNLVPNLLLHQSHSTPLSSDRRVWRRRIRVMQKRSRLETRFICCALTIKFRHFTLFFLIVSQYCQFLLHAFHLVYALTIPVSVQYLQGLSLLTIRVSVKSLRRFMNIKDIFIKQNSVCIVCVMACHEPHKVHTVVDALSNFFQQFFIPDKISPNNLMLIYSFCNQEKTTILSSQTEMQAYSLWFQPFCINYKGL